jgi:hypothetical protein
MIPIWLGQNETASYLLYSDDLRELAETEGISFHDLRTKVWLSDGTTQLAKRHVPLAK